MSIAAARSYLASRLRRWWELEWMPWLDWMQIEVTSRCNAACIYCPRTVYGPRWKNRDLSPDTFEKLLPVLSKTKMVHLQGWGEPLLYGHFHDLVARIKKAGCKVGTTTNGMLLGRREIGKLVTGGMDHVAFSLTGIGAKNDAVRKGTSFVKVVEAIADIAAEKKALGVETPAVNVAYLLLRSHLPDINDIVPALSGLGIGHVVVSTLDFVPDGELRNEQLIPRDEAEYRELKAVLDGLAAKGRQAGLHVSYRLVSPDKGMNLCAENPGASLFVSADGDISPCVFTNIPVSQASHVVESGERDYQPLTFGAVNEKSVPVIWLGGRYRAFRDSFDAELHPSCRECPKRLEI